MVHGNAFTITGSGFGTKAAGYDTPFSTFLNWDNCSHGQTLATRWDTAYPTGNTSSGDDMAYRANGFRSVNCPSRRSTGFAAGACNGVGSATNLINTALIKQFTRPTTNGNTGSYMFYSKWYEQADVNYDTTLGSPNDGNYKLLDFGTTYLGSGADDSFYLGAFVGGSNGGSSTAMLNAVGGNDDAGFSSTPNFLNMSESGSAGIGNFGKSRLDRIIIGAWVELQAWYLASNSTDSRLACYTSAVPGASAADYDIYTGLVHGGSTLTCNHFLDTFTNRTTRQASIGSYNRAYPGPNQYRYFSDIYQDFGEGWFFLTNAASWGGETIREIQPYTSWSDTSVTFTVNGGQLPAGTVYLHFRKAPWQGSGHQALGPYTLSG